MKALETLAALHGGFGREGSISRYIEDTLREAGYNAKTDEMGSVTVTLGKAGGRVFLTGIDTVAYYVTSFDADGTVRVGSVPSRKFSSPISLVSNSGVHGILTGEDTVDIGERTREEAEMLLHTGEALAPEATVRRIGGKLVGANLSRRGMAAILLDILLKKPSGITASHIIFAAQDLASRGTLCALDAAMPSVAVSLTATDSAKCGDGALVIMKDGGIVSNIELCRALSDIAKRESIRSTPVVSDKSSGAQNVLTYAGTGARVCGIGIPCERAGTEYEGMLLSDLEEVSRLVYSALTEETEEF